MLKILSILLFITITDKVSREITLPTFPKRIVVLSSDIAETICALGCKGKIVGISRFAKSSPFLPERVKNLPSCGDWKAINLEQIIMLSPDLVILGEGGNAGEIAKSLKSRGIQVLIICPTNIYELGESIVLLGKILGCEERAQKLKSFMVERAKLITNIVKNSSKPSIYLAGSNPYYTFAKGSAWASLIELAGGVNVAGKLNYPWPKISAEILIKWNPEIILIVGDASYGTEWFINKRELRCIRAIKKGKVYKLGPYLSWSPRLILALIEMAKYIHPEECMMLNFEKEKKELGEIGSLKY